MVRVCQRSRFRIALTAFMMTGTNIWLESPRGMAVRFTEESLVVELRDGRVISTPLLWYPRLESASAQDRGEYEWIGGGTGIHWPRLDEDLSVAGMLAGQPSTEFLRGPLAVA